MFRILIAEDDPSTARLLCAIVKRAGYEPLIAADGVQALELLDHNQIDLLLCDVMMPRMDGFTLTRTIRESGSMLPILMLTAKDMPQDKHTGFIVGTDDYMTKPFVPMELLARVSSQLRRYHKYLEATSTQKNQNIYTVGGLELNLDTKTVSVDNQPIKVTPIEFKILELLMAYPGKVFSAENIYESVWKEDAINTDTVMVHVRNLREKIEIDPKHPQYLKVVWGVGYKIEKQGRDEQ